jgi:TM2 domain-containing membrane protein YozV
MIRQGEPPNDLESQENSERPRVKRWVWAAGGLVVLCSLLALGAARMAGGQGSRPAALISVVTGWLGAWVLWGFVGGLANHYGLARYDGTLFALLAVAGAVWQYRVQTRQGRPQGLAVFVAGQLLWLGVVLYQNGVLMP